jgi:hypothetical protein
MARLSARMGVTEKKQSEATSPELRAARLTQTRNLKMARSAHAYVRGNTVKFYEWLEASAGKVPEGPPVWICGDCHLGNLGPLADTKGRVAIQIRDLDQTVIGNPAHDLIRLGLSLASAARGSNLPGVTMARILEQLVSGYEKALSDDIERGKDKIYRPKKYRICLNIPSGAAGGSLPWSGWNQSRRFFRWEKGSGPWRQRNARRSSSSSSENRYEPWSPAFRVASQATP